MLEENAIASDIDICSAALLLLGADPIASLTENTKRATQCANIYPLARLDLLRMHPWNCAIKRVILAPLTEEPPFDWGFQFNKPGDWLRTLQVGNKDFPLDYEFEGNRILANTDTLPFRYVADVNEGNWDSNLVGVMIKRMEMDLAYPITKSASLRDSLKQEFYTRGVGVLARAKAVDGQENPPEEWNDSPLIAVRG